MEVAEKMKLFLREYPSWNNMTTTMKIGAKNAQFSQITKAISALFDSVVFFSNPKTKSYCDYFSSSK